MNKLGIAGIAAGAFFTLASLTNFTLYGFSSQENSDNAKKITGLYNRNELLIDGTICGVVAVGSLGAAYFGRDRKVKSD
jgi:hypothetical protein